MSSAKWRMCKLEWPQQRLDGKEDKWATLYLCTGQPLVYLADYAEGFKIKLSDIGGGKYFLILFARPILFFSRYARDFFVQPIF